jgi:RNA polymerase sigma-70 factor (ECF subfamily)
MKKDFKRERSAGAIEDQVLVDKVLAGDDRAFEKLVEKYKKRIYYLAYRMTRDHDSADELAQESFVRAYQALSGFNKEYSFYTWIYRICMNLSINFIKREQQSVSAEYVSEKDLNYSSREIDQLDRLIMSEQVAFIKKELDNLPPDQKAAFILRSYENLSYEEIAEVLRCSVGTVMSRLFRARYKLKTALRLAESGNDVNDEEM